MSFQGTKINPKRFDVSQIKFHMILLPLSIFMILPVIYIISQAFKSMDEIYRFPPTIIVEDPTIRNFQTIMSMSSSTGVPMSRYLINSFIVTLITVLCSIVLTALSAYALSKKKFRAKGWLLSLNQAAMMFVPLAVMVPRYLVITTMNLGNNPLAHVLPLLAMPVSVFLVKQFVDQVPDSLLEAAKIDGAGEPTIILRIVFPLITPALATAGILAFQAVWNATESSNLFIQDDSLKTLAFYLANFTIGNNPAMAGVSAAASLIMFAPNLIIFIVMQSRVMNTMSHSGIK